MKTITDRILWMLLGDCGYHYCYQACPNFKSKLQRWIGFRIGHLPNIHRPWAEKQPALKKYPGSLVPCDGPGIGGSHLRQMEPGEILHERC